MKKVSFIPNSSIKYHIGIRKDFPGKAQLLVALEKGMKDPKFIAKKRDIEAKYRKTRSAG